MEKKHKIRNHMEDLVSGILLLILFMGVFLSVQELFNLSRIPIESVLTLFVILLIFYVVVISFVYEKFWK